MGIQVGRTLQVMALAACAALLIGGPLTAAAGEADTDRLTAVPAEAPAETSPAWPEVFDQRPEPKSAGPQTKPAPGSQEPSGPTGDTAQRSGPVPSPGSVADSYGCPGYIDVGGVCVYGPGPTDYYIVPELEESRYGPPPAIITPGQPVPDDLQCVSCRAHPEGE